MTREAKIKSVVMLVLARQTRICGGSSESELKVLTVIPAV